ncbi:MAG: SDR family oxidoreductase, partial [Cytophagales bacterium]|nr:SDR family oxidoreductase [Cytophagales bacterium]
LCLITGANSGIGLVTARELARQGMDIIMVCRNAAKGEQARQDILAASRTKKVDLLLADLADFGSVRKLAAEVRGRYSRLDVLVNNAGLVMDQRTTTPQGIETTFATNHLGPFLLTNLLLDLVRKGHGPRIVHVSSEAHRFARFRPDDLVAPKKYTSMVAYGNSKLANILFSNELARRLAPDGITSNSLHPGVIKTNFGAGASGVFGLLSGLARPFLLTPEKGAETSIYLAASPEVKGRTGGYYDKKKPKTPSADARSDHFARELWALSSRLTEVEG